LSYSSCQQTKTADEDEDDDDDNGASFSQFVVLVVESAVFSGEPPRPVPVSNGTNHGSFIPWHKMDHLLFEISMVGLIRPHTGVPTVGTLLTILMTVTVGLFDGVRSLSHYHFLRNTLMVFTFVNAGIIVLRTTPPTPTVTTDDEMIDVDENHNNSHNNSYDMLPTNERASLIISHWKTTNNTNTTNENKNKKCCGRRSYHLLPDEGGIMTIKNNCNQFNS